LENIKKGSFVVEYVGEVITNEEAEERGKKYGMFYNYYANYSTMVFLYFFRKKSIRF
jgi:SET domain-containing protein